MTHGSQILLAAATILIAPFFGAILMGLDRKVTARIQGRIGPPILQPIYDIAKLLSKAQVLLNKQQVIWAMLHLAFMALTLVLVVLGQDYLMVLFVLAFSILALIIGGMCVRSPYSRIGSQREIMLMMAYEPILILMVVGVYKTTGSFMVRDIWTYSQPLLFSMPLLFLAFLAVLAIKLQKSPFDLATSHHAHQEIVKGLTLEYAGPYLAVIEIAHCYEVALLFVMTVLFWATNLWAGLALAILSFFLMTVIDNACARLTALWAFRFMWTMVLGLALTNIIWLYI